MNRDEKAAVVDAVAEQIQGADAIFAVDYRGISVKQAKELRVALADAGARYPSRLEQRRPRPPAGCGRKTWAGGSPSRTRSTEPACVRALYLEKSE